MVHLEIDHFKKGSLHNLLFRKCVISLKGHFESCSFRIKVENLINKNIRTGPCDVLHFVESLIFHQVEQTLGFVKIIKCKLKIGFYFYKLGQKRSWKFHLEIPSKLFGMIPYKPVNKFHVDVIFIRHFNLFTLTTQALSWKNYSLLLRKGNPVLKIYSSSLSYKGVFCEVTLFPKIKFEHIFYCKDNSQKIFIHFSWNFKIYER